MRSYEVLRKIVNKLPKGFKVLLRGTMFQMRHYRGVIYAKKYYTCADLKLHLGCGNKLKEGWINIDINKGVDLTLDLRKELPFVENSCAIIYNEHFLEHLDYPTQVTFFLKECFRILKPSGIFSVGVPDSEWPIRAYIEGDKAEYFELAKELWHPQWCTTRMEHINYHFRQEREHLFAYDFETLKHILEICGFKEVNRRNFNTNLDSEHRRLGTLYVDAIKPDSYKLNP